MQRPILHNRKYAGWQATKLMQEGQAELAQAWKLTPDMIATYTKNMSEGLNDIIDNAPMQAQLSLATQFTSNLQHTTGQLNQKMIGQQKQDALQKATMFNNSQLTSIYEAARSGDVDSAKKMAEDMRVRSNSMAAAGMYSPLQADAAHKSAQNSLYTGLFTGEALKAYDAKNADQYLADFTEKTEGMNTLQWEVLQKM